MAAHDTVEPDLEQMLHDPIVLLLMKRDGVEPKKLKEELTSVSQRISQTGLKYNQASLHALHSV